MQPRNLKFTKGIFKGLGKKVVISSPVMGFFTLCVPIGNKQICIVILNFENWKLILLNHMLVNQSQKRLALGTDWILISKRVNRILNSLMPIFLKILKIPFSEFLFLRNALNLCERNLRPCTLHIVMNMLNTQQASNSVTDSGTQSAYNVNLCLYFWGLGSHH